MIRLVRRARRFLAALGVISVLATPATQLAHAESMAAMVMPAAAASCDHGDAAANAGHSSAPTHHHHRTACCDFCGTRGGAVALPSAPVLLHVVASLAVVSAAPAPVTAHRSAFPHRLPFAQAPPALS